MQPERIVFDMGSNAVTGIHVKALENLRNFYGLEKRPVRVIEPYQMMGLVEPDLMEAIGIDVIGIWGEDNLEEFSAITKQSLAYWKTETLKASAMRNFR